MSGYIDLQAESEAAWQEREYRRRRLLAGIRGCIRRKAQPRWLVVFALLISATPAAAIGCMAYRLGLSAWGPAEGLAVLSMWPIFIFVAWKMGGRLFEKIDVLENLEASVGYDLSCEAAENANYFGAQYGDIGVGIDGGYESEYRRGFWNGMRSGLQQSLGGSVIALPLIVLVSLGTWLVWQLIRSSPVLLAEIIFDGYLIRKMPSLPRRAILESWKENAFAATAIHFIGFALVMVLLGGVLHCLAGVGGHAG